MNTITILGFVLGFVLGTLGTRVVLNSRKRVHRKLVESLSNLIERHSRRGQ